MCNAVNLCWRRKVSTRQNDFLHFAAESSHEREVRDSADRIFNQRGANDYIREISQLSPICRNRMFQCPQSPVFNVLNSCGSSRMQTVSGFTQSCPFGVDRMHN